MHPRRMGGSAVLLSLLAAVAAASPIGDLQTFRDWIVGCDNLHSCHATTLIPEPTDEEIATGDEPVADNSFNLSLRRGGGMNNAPRIRLFDCYMCEAEKGREPGLARELRVKGKDGTILAGKALTGEEATRLGSDDGLSLPSDDRLIEALTLGETAEVLDGEGRSMAVISLRGLQASMRYMDEDQHRIGNVTALVARGSARALLVPPWVPFVNIYVPPPSDLPPARPSRAKLKALQQQYRCRGAGAGLPETTFQRLDAHATMLLLFANCSSYNGEGYVFLVGEDREIRPAPVRLTAQDPELELPQVISSYWDKKTRRLHSFGRGRAFADCGQEQAFAWDGDQFILVEEADMGDCRGSIDYITVYRRETAVRGQHR